MIEFSYEALTKQNLLEANNEKVKIIKDGVDFYFYIHLKKENPNLLIHSNGAINLNKSTPPVFLRHTWKNEIDASCIYIDDRTIHDTPLNLAWGIGTPQRHYLIDYHEIVIKISQLLNIESNHVFYFGSSGGGFMSIMLATMHKHSTAIVNNPQAFVHRYNKNTIEKVYNYIFPEMTVDEVNKQYTHRLSSTALMKKENNVPEMFYIQNRLSETDMREHLRPFFKMLDKYKMNSKPIKLILYNDSVGGHNPIPKDKTLELINGIINRNITIF